MTPPTEELTRCAAAILIGAFVGLERQARLELGAGYEGEEPSGSAAPGPAGEAAERDSAGPSGSPAARADARVPDGEQVAGVRTFSARRPESR